MTAALSDLVFSPLVDPLWLWAIAGITLLLALYAAWRRAPGAILRSVAMAAVLLALANPQLVSETRRPIADVAVIVVDDSPSQQIGDRPARTEAALKSLGDALAQFRDLEVRIVRTDGRSEKAPGTHLFEAADRAVSGITDGRLAATFVITDGQVHGLPDPQDRASSPVHVLLTGERRGIDRRLVIGQAPNFGLVGKQVEVSMTVEDLGGAFGAAAQILVRRDGKLIDTLNVSTGQQVVLPLDILHAGENIFEFEAAGLANELTLRNNRAVLPVNGVRDRLRVLLVSGEPHPGERTWRNLLKSDPAVDLVHFTILRPPEKADRTPLRELALIAFPIRELFEVKLQEFDLIIFDRYRRRGVLPPIYLGNIAQYVREGGALLLAVGPEYATNLSLAATPLGDVLPAEPNGEVLEAGFRARVTDTGARHPVTADILGAADVGDEPRWGRWFRQIGAVPRAGDVLMNGPSGPMLVMSRPDSGSSEAPADARREGGRVAMLLSDHIWLWSRGFEGGGPAPELLRRVAHWLMKEPDLEENSLVARPEGENLRIQRRSLVAGPADVTLTRPDGSEERIRLEPDRNGIATASVPASEPGLYALRGEGLETLVAVGDINPVEFFDVRASPEPLAAVVEASGGAHRWLVDDPNPALRRTRKDASRSGDGFLGVIRNEDYVVTGVTRTPAAPPLAALALLLALLVLAWRREGK
jgi:hypothetical protein